MIAGGRERSGRPGPSEGSVDYRLDRRRVLRQFNKGVVERAEICDAQPELLRVARDYSQPARTACPVCDERTLRHVRFVFGPRLPQGGRCINSPAELERLALKAGEYWCYLVEVCVSCRWNHLLTHSLLQPATAPEPQSARSKIVHE